MRNNVNADASAGKLDGRDGVLRRVDPDASVTQWCCDLGVANTVAWSPDGSRFYFGDSLDNVVWIYDYDSGTGAIQNRPFLQGYPRGLPDGSCVGAAGFLWNRRFFGGCIVRVAPDGQIDRVVEMPVQNITTCAVGGVDRSSCTSPLRASRASRRPASGRTVRDPDRGAWTTGKSFRHIWDSPVRARPQPLND